MAGGRNSQGRPGHEGRSKPTCHKNSTDAHVTGAEGARGRGGDDSAAHRESAATGRVFGLYSGG